MGKIRDRLREWKEAAAQEVDGATEAELRGDETQEEGREPEQEVGFDDLRAELDPATGDPWNMERREPEEPEEEGPEGEDDAEGEEEAGIDEAALAELTRRAAEKAEAEKEKFLRDMGIVNNLSHDEAAEVIQRTAQADKVRARELAEARKRAVHEYVQGAITYFFQFNPDLVSQQKEVTEWLVKEASKGRWVKDFDPGAGLDHSARVAMEIADEYRRKHPLKETGKTPPATLTRRSSNPTGEKPKEREGVPSKPRGDRQQSLSDIVRERRAKRIAASKNPQVRR